MLLSLLRLWTGPLPTQELFPTDRKIDPVKHWIVHPLKRHIARIYLWKLQHLFGLKVIAITGSYGKTTTTDLLYSILSLLGPTIKTATNTTTTYNLPTTIFKCTPRTRFLVLEMGIEYPGDMDFYCWLAKPNLATVLNVGPVHAQFLGSVENIKTEKYKLQKYAKKFYSPDKYYKIISAKLTPQLTTEINLKDVGRVNLKLLGTQFAHNAAAAALLGSNFTSSLAIIRQGLEATLPPIHRFNLHPISSTSFLIDDTHNANPDATLAALNTLSELCQITNKIPVVIFGQMNELGLYEKSAHQKIGLEIKKLGIKNLYSIGPATQGTIDTAGVGKLYRTQEELLKELKKLTSQKLDLIILVKGSHSWHLENLVSALNLPNL